MPRTRRQQFLDELVYPALLAWAADRRTISMPVQGYPSSTLEGRFAAMGEAALCRGSGLYLEQPPDDVELVESFLATCRSVEADALELRHVRGLTEAQIAVRLGYTSRQVYQSEIARVYDRLHGYLLHARRVRLDIARHSR